jgi:hypothetical protein
MSLLSNDNVTHGISHIHIKTQRYVVIRKKRHDLLLIVIVLKFVCEGMVIRMIRLKKHFMSLLSNDNVTLYFYMYIGIYGVSLSFERSDNVCFLNLIFIIV